MSEYLKYIPEVIVVLAVFIQITPIKINPISWLGNALMRNTNGKIETLSKTIDVNEIENLRRVILKFAYECQNGQRHSQEQFDQVFKDKDKYYELLEKHNLKNGRVDRDLKYIEDIYKNCQKKGTFIN